MDTIVMCVDTGVLCVDNDVLCVDVDVLCVETLVVFVPIIIIVCVNTLVMRVYVWVVVVVVCVWLPQWCGYFGACGYRSCGCLEAVVMLADIWLWCGGGRETVLIPRKYCGYCNGDDGVSIVMVVVCMCGGGGGGADTVAVWGLEPS